MPLDITDSGSSPPITCEYAHEDARGRHVASTDICARREGNHFHNQLGGNHDHCSQTCHLAHQVEPEGEPSHLSAERDVWEAGGTTIHHPRSMLECFHDPSVSYEHTDICVSFRYPEEVILPWPLPASSKEWMRNRYSPSGDPGCKRAPFRTRQLVGPEVETASCLHHTGPNGVSAGFLPDSRQKSFPS